MQRRAAAVYFAFFVILAASGYTVIAFAQPPEVDAPGETVSNGDVIEANGQTYNVQNVSKAEVGDGHGGTETNYFGRVVWTEEDAEYTAEFENNSTVSGLAAEWPDMAGQYRATIESDDTVVYEGNETTAEVNEENLTLRHDGEAAATLEVGDTLQYRGNETTLASLDGDTATLEWADDYRVAAPNVSDPGEFTFRQQYNVTKLLRNDPAVENETVTREDGREYVVYEANGSTEPLDEYLPARDERTFSEGDTLTYDDNETTVAEVTNQSVTLSWTSERTNSVELSQGSNVTFGGQTYTVYYESEDTVRLIEDYQAYQEDLDRIDYFHERMNGFWGIVDLSLLAALLILAMAYMPVRG